MATFKLSRTGGRAMVTRYLDGAEPHAIVYATLTGSAADRRRQYRALTRQFNVTHG